MSQEESRLLKDVGLRYSEVAECLGLTRQAVTKGIERNAPYLVAKRVSEIFSRLQTSEREDVAEKFRTEINKRFPEIGREAFKAVPIEAILDQLTENAEPPIIAKELWVFSSRPLEIFRPFYILKMKEQIYKIQSEEIPTIRRVVYFVPPDISRTLSTLIIDTLNDIPPHKRNHILIVESPAIQIVPHFVVFDPRTSPIGMIMADTKDRFIRMAQIQVTTILDYLRKLGIGLHQTRLILRETPVERHPEKPVPAALEFQLYFDSQNHLPMKAKAR